MIGLGMMAAVDEIAFHQILGWHHFYDRSTRGVALLSDGILHATELIVVVAGFFLFADLRRRQALAPRTARAGVLLGLGAFQLFDGLVHHKVLRSAPDPLRRRRTALRPGMEPRCGDPADHRGSTGLAQRNE